MRILALIPTMGPGGAERAMARLTWSLAERHDVALMTWEPPDMTPFYDLSASVRLVRGGLMGGSGWTRARRLLTRFGVIRGEVRRWKPDVVLSFMDTMNITAVISCYRTGVPVVVSERTDPSRHRIGRFKSTLRVPAYGLADCVVVQTERVRRVFPRWMRRRIEIIPNAAPKTETAARPDKPHETGRFRIIGLGRLGHEKGFDRLVSAFKAVASRHPDWDLVIFGEGAERAALEGLAPELTADGRIRFPGITRDPAAELLASHLMVFPSRYEGFPNALAEAIGAGLPAIALADVAGVEELVIPGKTGLLVDPSDAVSGLIAALDRLLPDHRLRAEFGRAARAHAARWAPDAIFGQWEVVLAAAAKKQRAGASETTGAARRMTERH